MREGVTKIEFEIHMAKQVNFSYNSHPLVHYLIGISEASYSGLCAQPEEDVKQQNPSTACPVQLSGPVPQWVTFLLGITHSLHSGIPAWPPDVLSQRRGLVHEPV